MHEDPHPMNGTAKCPACGAALSDGARSCGQCSRPLPPEPETPSGPIANDVPVTELSRRGPPLQFSLTSLLLIVTLSAVVFGGFAYSPCLGSLFAMLAAPAAVYTVIAARRRQTQGAPMCAAEKLLVFGVGMSVVALVLLLVALYLISW